MKIQKGSFSFEFGLRDVIYIVIIVFSVFGVTTRLEGHIRIETRAVNSEKSFAYLNLDTDYWCSFWIGKTGPGENDPRIAVSAVRGPHVGKQQKVYGTTRISRPLKSDGFSITNLQSDYVIVEYSCIHPALNALKFWGS